MADKGAEEKTEPASERRLREAHEKGQVAKSEDLASSASMLAGFLAVMALAPWGARQMTELFLAVERLLPTIDRAGLQVLLMQSVHTIAWVSLAPAAVAALVHTAALFLQTGSVFSADPLQPKMEKLNPASNLERLFSMRTVVQFVQVVLKLFIIGVTVWLIFVNLAPDAIRVIHGDIGAALAVARLSMLHLLLWCGAFFIFLGAADYGFQKWQFLRDQRMSKSEVKRELRDDEGDPHFKAERKRLGQELSPAAQLSYMRLAKLVLHHSDGRIVVLTHLPQSHELPLFILRGTGQMAARALTLARNKKVREVADDFLANRLFPLAETGMPVPEENAELVLMLMTPRMT
jgi:type III secretion protein U